MPVGALNQTKTNHTADYFIQWSLCAIIASLHIPYVQGPLLCSFSDIHLTFKINPHSSQLTGYVTETEQAD